MRVDAAQMAPDLRRETTPAQFQAFLADPDGDPWQFLFFDNTSADDHQNWSDPESSDFALLNGDQQSLVLVGNADGEIQNGGIGQLFFNQAGYVPAMQGALAKMGCKFAAELLDKELDRLAQTSFIADWQAAQTGFSANSKAGNNNEAWRHFTSLVEKYFPEPDGENDPATQAYYDKREETLACVRNYIGQNANSFVTFGH
jgi:hypothetical protein